MIEASWGISTWDFHQASSSHSHSFPIFSNSLAIPEPKKKETNSPKNFSQRNENGDYVGKKIHETRKSHHCHALTSITFTFFFRSPFTMVENTTFRHYSPLMEYESSLWNNAMSFFKGYLITVCRQPCNSLENSLKGSVGKTQLQIFCIFI